MKSPLSRARYSAGAEARALDLDDAEALAGRRLHHHPAIEPARDLGAQLLEARDLGGDVVGLDVDVDAALMLDALNLHDRLVGRRLEHAVGAAAHRMRAVDGTAQGFRPKARRRVHIGDLAIDQHGAKARVVHVGFLDLHRTVDNPGARGLHPIRRRNAPRAVRCAQSAVADRRFRNVSAGFGAIRASFKLRYFFPCGVPMYGNSFRISVWGLRPVGGASFFVRKAMR